MIIIVPDSYIQMIFAKFRMDKFRSVATALAMKIPNGNLKEEACVQM